MARQVLVAEDRVVEIDDGCHDKLLDQLEDRSVKGSLGAVDLDPKVLARLDGLRIGCLRNEQRRGGAKLGVRGAALFAE